MTDEMKKEFIFLCFKQSRGDFFVLGISEQTWVETLTKKLLNTFAIF